ncbi:MAG TPA: hypothetical protein VG078_04350 [Acidimicrobiales bacterium]|nr:hypothetical protein [Acidimicrobiales bacterium]
MTIPTLRARRGRAPRALAAMAALLLAVLVGCGGDDGGGGDGEGDAASPAGTVFTGQADKACGLAPKAEVESAIGAVVKAGTGANGILCRFDLATAAEQFVLLSSTQSPDSPKTFDAFRTAAPNAETLPGVGDRAFVASNQAYVLKGTTLTVVTINLKQPQAAITAAAKKMAQVVASHS